MPIGESDFYKTRLSILSEILSDLVAQVPDAYTGDDGIIYILLSIISGQFENNFLANQLLLEDLFVQTASQTALRLHGEQYGLAFKDGIKSSGTLKFTGQPGTYVPFNTEAAYDPGTGIDPVYFQTTVDGTIPNVGTPTAPTTAIHASAGNLNGTYIYRVAFVTSSGTSAPSIDSAAVSPVSQQVDLTNIPIGGPGTLARVIYREKNGSGDYRFVALVNDNVSVAYTDNITDAVVNAAAAMQTIDTSNVLFLLSEAQDPGIEGNVAAGTITDLTNAPSGLTDVTNTFPFTGGSDPEDTEDFRIRLLGRIRSPQTGSASDLKTWAEAIDGVENATVFPNDNLGVTQAGHVTVRIAGPDGSVPGADVLQEVNDTLTALDFVNVTLHITTFTPISTNVTVVLTISTGFTHTDVDGGVTQAIKDYINSLEAGETLYRNGIVDAIFGLNGIDDVSVTVPASASLSTPASSKRVPGTISVT